MPHQQGLMAGVWTASGGTELPFGFVKASGHDQERGFEALRGFSSWKTVPTHHGLLCHTLSDNWAKGRIMGDTRINARLDEEAQKQIEYLVQATGQSTSHVVREAIAVYHAQVRQSRPLPKRLLAMAGKYRSVDDRGDVASNYKQHVAEAIEAKYAVSHPRPASPAPAAKRPVK